MTPYLQVENLSKSFGSRTLFENISFGIAERQRIGLIARNGTGKTTLLNILAGKDFADEGKITFKRDLHIGYLEQTPTFRAGATVIEACMELEGTDLSQPEREMRAKQVLSSLNIDRLEEPVSLLSGGQQKRVALARVLIEAPDMLILDEPTNHLDLGMIEWLEEYLRRSTMALLMVTHDRYFLERVCSVIIELDNDRLYTYKGNYSYYIEKRQERIEVANATAARAQNLYRRELEWMRSTPCARSSKAEYRKQAFYELKELTRKPIEEEIVKLEIKGTYIGNKIFEAEYVSKAFHDRIILKDFYYNFARYEKMGIVGDNGTGKSTFIKLLLGLVKPDKGRFVVGETVKFGYYSQEGMQFDEQMRVIDAVRKIAEYVDLGGGKHLTAMQFLQHFMFSPKDQQNYIYKLSGGERRRLYLCTVLMQSPNFLVLDEPTNDLDIATLQVLEEYLATFKGCVIVVSHDRYFMDRVVDHLLVFKGQGDIKDFPGSYTLYRDWQAVKEKKSIADSDRKEKIINTELGNENGRNQNRKQKLTYKQKQELQQLEMDIEKLETEKSALEFVLCGGTLSVEEITTASKRLPLLQEELDEKSMRWLELSEIEG